MLRGPLGSFIMKGGRFLICASKKQVGTRIKKWLEHEGFTVQLTTPKDFEFVIDVDDPNSGVRFAVSQPRGTESIGITTRLVQPKEVVDIFKQVDKELRIELLQSMHRELLKMIQDHNIDGGLKSISLIEKVFVENLTRQKLIECIIRLRNSSLYLLSVLRHQFAGLQTPQPKTSDFSMYH